jgi:DNA (cytosine-5)-methyltransferase 1
MSAFKQYLLDTHDELIVDLFAGGGGASSGIEEGLGRMVDIAINHDKKAVEMHRANHPQTVHLCSDIFEVDPRSATLGRPVGLLWASPDCTYHSKARGSKPIRHASRKRRALVWVVTRWAGTVRPRVIALENVEEFQQWGPLIGKPDELRPNPKKRGRTFKAWVKSLEDLGYSVEWRELRACDYGAPTIRKRLFIIARCDGQPIVWPEPTHGKGARLKPFVPVSTCIDWSLPMCSVFATKEEAREWAKEHSTPGQRMAVPQRPLADQTMARIARGVDKFVVNNPEPFLVNVANSKTTGRGPNVWSVDEPVRTVTSSNGFAVVSPFVAGVGGRQGQSPNRSTAAPFQTITAKADSALVAPILASYHNGPDGMKRTKLPNQPIDTLDCSNRYGVIAPFLSPITHQGGPRGSSADSPAPTITCANRGEQALAVAFLGQNNGGHYDGCGRPADEPMATILANSRGHFPLTVAHIQRDFGTSTGHPVTEPLKTITTEGGGKAALVYSFLTQYNGTSVGQPVSEPANTSTAKDRFGVVTVQIQGEPYVIEDIGMRMLQPHELYRAQGFREGYIHDRTADGTPITKTDQVRMCGNSVCPPVARAIVLANCADMIARPKKEMLRRAA